MSVADPSRIRAELPGNASGFSVKDASIVRGGLLDEAQVARSAFGLGRKNRRKEGESPNPVRTSSEWVASSLDRDHGCPFSFDLDRFDAGNVATQPIEPSALPRIGREDVRTISGLGLGAIHGQCSTSFGFGVVPLDEDHRPTPHVPDGVTGVLGRSLDIGESKGRVALVDGSHYPQVGAGRSLVARKPEPRPGSVAKRERQEQQQQQVTVTAHGRTADTTSSGLAPWPIVR